MQPEQIILISPNHEQSTPSFHVEGSLADDFIVFLKSNDITIWQEPKTLDISGPDGQPVIEIEVESGTPVDGLEKLIPAFLQTRNAPTS